MHNLYTILPELEMDELTYIQGLLKDWEEGQIQQFAVIYRSRRINPQTVLLTTLLGFLFIAGVQRFIIGQIGMGLLYLFTGGICLIGTIIDLVNYRRLAFEYNQKQSFQIAMMIKASV